MTFGAGSPSCPMRKIRGPTKGKEDRDKSQGFCLKPGLVKVARVSSWFLFQHQLQGVSPLGECLLSQNGPGVEVVPPAFDIHATNILQAGLKRAMPWQRAMPVRFRRYSSCTPCWRLLPVAMTQQKQRLSNAFRMTNWLCLRFGFAEPQALFSRATTDDPSHGKVRGVLDETGLWFWEGVEETTIHLVRLGSATCGCSGPHLFSSPFGPDKLTPIQICHGVAVSTPANFSRFT